MRLGSRKRRQEESAKSPDVFEAPGFKPLLYGNHRGVGPDFFPERNRTSEQENLNSVHLSTS
jgi:hypothetical protein